MKTLLKFVGFVCICAVTKGFAILAYLIWKYGTKWTDKKAKDGFQKIKWQKQNKIIAFTLCLVGFIINVGGKPQVQQTQVQQPQVQVQQTQCKFDGSTYKRENRSNMLLFGKVGEHYKGLEAYHYNHKSNIVDKNTQIISWEQNGVVYGMYIHVTDEQSFVTPSNYDKCYVTINSIEHDVVLSTELMKAGLTDTRDIKMMDVYVAHVTLDHNCDDDED